MSTAKMVCVALFLLLAFGIVGRMDYEDAKRVERASGKEGIRLFCVHYPIDASAEGGLSKSGRATALLVSVAPTANVAVSAPAVLRCVVLDQ
jgi:hypothetical protein